MSELYILHNQNGIVNTNIADKKQKNCDVCGITYTSVIRALK